jgi:hypothetical protein
MFEEPAPLRAEEPVPEAVRDVVARLLDKRPRRRATVAELVRAVEGAMVTAGAAGPPSPAARALLAAVPLLAGVVLLTSSGDPALARSVEAAIARGDLAAARSLLDDAARSGRAGPVVEKLRGDLACARGASGECLRRYRVALAARPELREDPALRRNARALLRRDQSCGTRRAAAALVGELRDREALPALEEARRRGGLFAFLCTGDAIDRAIAATRSAPE